MTNNYFLLVRMQSRLMLVRTASNAGLLKHADVLRPLYVTDDLFYLKRAAGRYNL